MLRAIVIRAAIAAAALALPATAHAEDWVYVSDTGGGKNWLDRDSVTLDNGIATLWVRSDFTGKQAEEWGGPRVQTLEQIDCAGKRIRLLEFVVFDASGTEVSHDIFKPGSKWIPIQSGAFG